MVHALNQRKTWPVHRIECDHALKKKKKTPTKSNLAKEGLEDTQNLDDRNEEANHKGDILGQRRERNQVSNRHDGKKK